jgi:hypothetical protein
MARAHKRLKKAERGSKEVPVKVHGRKGRLDATTKDRAVEIERSGRYDWATKKLLKSRKRSKILRVPKSEMPKAREAVQSVVNISQMKDPSVTITSLNKKSRSRVRKKKK